MSNDIQQLKADIITQLDALPPQQLQILAELVKKLQLDPLPELPAASPQNEAHSIWNLGSNPVRDGEITDASTNLDQYLYGP